MKFLLVAFIGFLSFTATSQEIKVIKLSQLQKIIEQPADHTRLFNFWASWCGPCIKEMPHFQSVNGLNNAEVILISMDFPQDLEKAKKILNKKQIELTTYLLDETDYDQVIPVVSEKWTGALPATLVVNDQGDTFFYERSFELEDIQEVVKQHTK